MLGLRESSRLVQLLCLSALHFLWRPSFLTRSIFVVYLISSHVDAGGRHFRRYAAQLIGHGKFGQVILSSMYTQLEAFRESDVDLLLPLCLFVFAKHFIAFSTCSIGGTVRWRHLQAQVRLVQVVAVLADVISDWDSIVDAFDQIHRLVHITIYDHNFRVDTKSLSP
jgi:hypothetical protein